MSENFVWKIEHQISTSSILSKKIESIKTGKSKIMLHGQSEEYLMSVISSDSVSSMPNVPNVGIVWKLRIQQTPIHSIFNIKSGQPNNLTSGYIKSGRCRSITLKRSDVFVTAILVIPHRGQDWLLFWVSFKGTGESSGDYWLLYWDKDIDD